MIVMMMIGEICIEIIDFLGVTSGGPCGRGSWSQWLNSVRLEVKITNPWFQSRGVKLSSCV